MRDGRTSVKLITGIRQAGIKKLGLLALLCVLLAFCLLRLGRAVVPPNGAAAEPRARPERETKGLPQDLASYNPHVDLEILQNLQARTAPEYPRNPFDFGITPAEKKAAEDKAKLAAMPLPTPISSPLLASAPPVPPPPPISLKALGYEEGRGVPRQAFIADCPNGGNCSEGDRDVRVYSARQGDSFANRYRVLLITVTGVEVEDEAYHRTAQLQFPQEGGRQKQ